MRIFNKLRSSIKRATGAVATSRGVERIKSQQSSGRSVEHGFLHIPKTGGSALSGYFREMDAEGYVVPTKFGHVWKAPKIKDRFPNIKLSLLIRDPLERSISGFNSRLRQGRPRNDNMWTVGEAASFAIFRDIHAFLKAMISDDDFDKSAVRFALQNIKHLNWNYQYYFNSAKWVKSNKSMLHIVGNVDDSLPFWTRLSAEFDIPQSVVEEQFRREHISSIPTASILDAYNPRQIQKMKKALAKEYEIYRSLRDIISVDE